ETHLTIDHLLLKNRLLSRELTAKDFLDQVMKLDQRSSERDDCLGNLELLNDPQIKERLIQDNPYIVHKYLADLGFYSFHNAQQLLDKEDPKSVDILRQAYQKYTIANEHLKNMLNNPQYARDRDNLLSQLEG